MDGKLRNFVTEKVNELIAAPTCCSEAKAAGEAFLKAAGSEGEDEELQKLVAELKEDIVPIDGLIAFARSSDAVQCFGAEGAKQFIRHAEELKAAGVKYCDCPACAAAEAITGL